MDRQSDPQTLLVLWATPLCWLQNVKNIGQAWPLLAEIGPTLVLGSRVLVLIPQLTCCNTQGNSAKLSGPQFSYL